MIPQSMTDFEEAWLKFEDKQTEIPENIQKVLRGVFMAGGYAAVGVLTNRLTALPGAVEPGDMVKALIDTIQVAMAELEVKAYDNFETES
jgi:hypothetical protein